MPVIREEALELERQGRHIVHATSCYQHARHGTKAVIAWWRTDRRQDAWIQDVHVAQGCYLVLGGGYESHGPHHRNPHVFWSL